VGAIAVCKSQSISVFAAEPETGGPGLVGALRTGIRCGEVKGQPSVADGLRVVTGPRNWEHIKRKGNVDGVFAVSEEQIIRAMGIVVEELGEVVEPSAAVGVAVVLYSEGFARRVTGMGGRVRVGVVLTGGNVRVGSIGDGAWVGSGRGGTVMR
jgi:threonine dehydratase